MDVLGSANQVQLNLFRTHKDEMTQMSALASGLRVSSASDDPSGYSISETLQTKINGLQQGVQNVQDAGNLLNVADATLNNVQTLLQRVHGLIVEAGSDLNSPEQLQSIQNEINQLLDEVNKISSGTKFNGITLLDGSLSNAPAQQGYFEIINPDTNPDGSAPSQNVADWQNPGQAQSGPLIFQDPAYPMFDTNAHYVSGFTEMQVISYSSNPTPPGGSPLGQPGVVIKFTQFSTNPNFNGTNGAQEQVSYGAYATDNGQIGPGTPPGLNINNADGSAPMLTPDLANLSAQDVGVAMAVETFDGTPAGTGNPLSINTGGSEGTDVTINLPNVSASALDVSGISVLQPQYVDGNNTLIGTGSNTQAVDDAEARVNNALNLISQVRAQVGAQSVAMQEDAGGASQQIVSQVASQSAIRDANIAQSTTQLTMDQVLSQVGTSVLAQMQNSAHLVVQLVGASNPSGAGRI